MGAAELFQITDNCSRHRNIDFPGHKHASLYDVMKVEPQVRRLLKEMGVEIHVMTRVIDVVTEIVELPEEKPKKYIKSLVASKGVGIGQNKTDVQTIEGDVFIE